MAAWERIELTWFLLFHARALPCTRRLRRVVDAEIRAMLSWERSNRSKMYFLVFSGFGEIMVKSLPMRRVGW